MEKVEILWGAGGFLAAFLIKELWDVLRKSRETVYNDLKIQVTEATKAVIGLTVGLQKFEVELKHLAEKVVSIPEIQKDLNIMGEKFRRLEKKEG